MKEKQIAKKKKEKREKDRILKIAIRVKYRMNFHRNQKWKYKIYIYRFILTSFNFFLLFKFLDVAVKSHRLDENSVCYIYISNIPINVKLLIKKFLGEQLCTVEAVSWWKSGSGVFLFAFQAALSEADELIIWSSISCCLFLYARSFNFSMEKTRTNEGRLSTTYEQQCSQSFIFLIA